MKTSKDKSEFVRMALLSAAALVVVGLAIWSTPDEPAARPAPRMAQRMRIVAQFEGGRSLMEKEELIAIMSPSLISQPNGVSGRFEETASQQISLIDPPSATPQGDTLYLAKERKQIQWTNCEYPDHNMAFALPNGFSPVASIESGERKLEKGGIRLSFSGGLSGKSVCFAPVPLQEWTEPNAPWFVAVRIQYNEDGSPKSVFLESPSGDESLNEKAVRFAYGSRLSSAGAAAEGRLTIWFNGAGANAI